MFSISNESRLVALMCLLAFLVLGLPRVFTASAAEALFLTSYGAQSLPYIYIIAAVVVPLVGAVYLQLQSRVSYAVNHHLSIASRVCPSSCCKSAMLINSASVFPSARCLTRFASAIASDISGRPLNNSKNSRASRIVQFHSDRKNA